LIVTICDHTKVLWDVLTHKMTFGTFGNDAVVVWDVWQNKKVAVPFTDNLRSVNAATLSPGGRFLALSSSHQSGALVVVYRLEDGSYKEWKKLQQNDIVNTLFLSRDGRTLVVRNHEDTARVFDVSSEADVTPDSLLTLRGVKAVALSSDGRFLLVAGRDGQTRLLDLAKGPKVAMLPLLDHTPMESLVFSPDLRYAGLGSEEGILHVFDLKSPQGIKEIARLTHTGRVTAVAFSNDNKYVATASSDPHPIPIQEEESYPLRVWLLRPGDLIAEAERRLKGLPQYPR
jgi:WD40 repeat protein